MRKILVLISVVAICGCGVPDPVEEEHLGEASQALTEHQAKVVVQNNSNCDIDSVTVDHKYSDVYKNSKVFSGIDRTQTSTEYLMVDYRTGTLGQDWWRVTWTCKGSPTRYFTDPNNLRGFVDGIESLTQVLLKVYGAVSSPGGLLTTIAPVDLDEYNGSLSEGVRLSEAQKTRIETTANASIGFLIDTSLDAGKGQLSGVGVAQGFALSVALLALDLSLNNESTDGYKSHILQDYADASVGIGGLVTIRINNNGTVDFVSSNTAVSPFGSTVVSDTDSTGVSTENLYPEAVMEIPGVETACFFMNAYMQGKYYCLNPGDTLDNVGSTFNDEFSSVLVSGGTVAIACRDSNFAGPCTTISSRRDAFGKSYPAQSGADDLSDEITSVKAVHRDSAAWTPYAPWGVGEPNNAGNEDCTTLSDGGKLNDTSCTDTNKYLCSRGHSAMSFQVTSSQGTWEGGYAACAREFPGYIFAPGVTYSEVPAARIALKNAGVSRVWTSLNDIAQEGSFVTGPGFLPSTAWNPGEPNNAGEEDCVEMKASTAGKLNDIPCSGSRRFLCKNSGNGSDPSTFAITAGSGVFSEGSATCAAEFPGYSFGAPSESERAAAMNVVVNSGVSVFINLTDTLSEGIFESMAPTSTRWASGEPNNAGGNEDCADLRSDMTMNDTSCMDTLRYLCSFGYSNYYKVTSASGAWANGHTACAQEFPGYIFASGINPGGADAVKQALVYAGNPTVWTSINDRNQEGIFVPDLPALDPTSTPWASGEPNNAGGNEDCADLRSDMTMNDTSCMDTLRYLCSLGDSNSYKVTIASGPWTGGHAACAKEFPGYIFAPGINPGGAQAVQQTLVNAGNPTVWTSINDRNQEGTFVPDLAGPAAHYHDVGVISADGNCWGHDPIEIRMHTENDGSSADLFSGWTGATRRREAYCYFPDWSGCSITAHQMVFPFCRVDGDALARYTPGFNESNFAVLKLGTECPLGSVEFTRHFDDEDFDNRSESVGDISPNVILSRLTNPTGSFTELTYCLFEAAQLDSAGVAAGKKTMAEFPFYGGLTYGVFTNAEPGSAVFPNSLDHGFVRTDAEDDGDDSIYNYHEAGPRCDAVCLAHAKEIVTDTGNTKQGMSFIRNGTGQIAGTW